jgi:hypothetical protein
MKIEELKLNDDNPRIIYNDKFEKLVASIKAFPKMMELRPIVVDKNNIILGGNMRYRALLKLEYKDIPAKWVKQAKDLTPQEREEFIIKDNVSFGGWDIETLVSEWDIKDLNDWGVQVPYMGNIDGVNKVNKLENTEWVGMPDFDAVDNPLRIIINFETEKDRKDFDEKYKFQFIKKQARMWTTWYPFRGRDDLDSLKYEEPDS